MKTYRAIRHDVVRKKQKGNEDTVHHPNEKIAQIRTTLSRKDYKILELFAGQGNLTKEYCNCGTVVAVEKKQSVFDILQRNLVNSKVAFVRADSYRYVHKLLYEGKKFNVVDLDPYGFPNRFFPDIFLLIEDGYLFITMPKPYVNILNGITQTHLISYYGEHNPSEETIISRIALWGLCHWRQVELIDSIDCKSVWRMVFKVTKVKATDYTGVRNK